MHRLPHDPDTEARIRDQVIADAIGDKQVTQAWARYLQDYVSFPFRYRGPIARRDQLISR